MCRGWLSYLYHTFLRVYIWVPSSRRHHVRFFFGLSPFEILVDNTVDCSWWSPSNPKSHLPQGLVSQPKSNPKTPPSSPLHGLPILKIVPSHPPFLLTIVELRHTEVWTRDHLDWFNVDFDPSRFHTIPIALTPANSPGQGSPMTLSHIHDLGTEELMQKVAALIEEYKGYHIIVCFSLTAGWFRQKWSGMVLPAQKRGKTIGLKWVLDLLGFYNSLSVRWSIFSSTISRPGNPHSKPRGMVHGGSDNRLKL